MNSWLLFAEIKSDLKQVEAELHQHVKSDVALLAETSAHLLKAGGKRLRPAFALLAGKFNNYSLKQLMPLAVALELIHMATLVHDDVIDASYTRRGIPTVKANWGNKVSIHTGDFLFAKSLLLVSQYENPAVARVLSRVSVEMCQGEIQQIVTAFDTEQNLKDYFYRIKRKTALLISASCQLGATVSGAPDYIIKALKAYGHNLGMAFQITDDVLDLVGDSDEFGKQIGSDLRQGIITLPVILMINKGKTSALLKEIVRKKNKNESDVQEAIQILQEGGGIDQALSISHRYLLKAKKELTKLPKIPTRDAMYYIADFVQARKF
ncbi:MAG: polyprenyl synthetase family protein [Clostridia bacterium]|nr:polyprenyl synthetase family protein [Clostridia bacterium]